MAAFGVIRAAHILHLRLICNVMRAPIPSFFDTTPMGRIQNRFSKDIDAIDEDIPDTFGGFLYCFLDVVTALFVVTYIFPMILAILPPLIVAYALIQVLVRNKSKKVGLTVLTVIVCHSSALDTTIFHTV